MSGLRRTTVINTVLVTITVVSLLTFSFAGLSGADAVALGLGSDSMGSGVLAAVAFLFVAFTGYGRVATLGEEVKDPDRIIPRAVIVTLAAAMAIYLLVALGGRAIGGPRWGVALQLGLTPASLVPEPFATVVLVGAVTAMSGVLLNLVLGLSRVWLAMGRRGDMPSGLALLDGHSQPRRAVLITGLSIALVCLIGDIRAAWSFSAFTVLLYYGITNLAALRLDKRRWTAWAGLATCLVLSFFIPLQIWLIGTGLIVLGLVWKGQRRV